jgi:hypothetical protein
LEGGVCASPKVVYCDRIDEMKALVEPLPLVPAMCIGFSRSNSEGWTFRQLPSSSGVIGSRTPHIQFCDTTQPSPVSPVYSCPGQTCESHPRWRSWTEAYSALRQQPATISSIQTRIAVDLPHSRASPFWQRCNKDEQLVYRASSTSVSGLLT